MKKKKKYLEKDKERFTDFLEILKNILVTIK
jgi:hypothetical protein